MERYKNKKMVKFNKDDYQDWEAFISKPGDLNKIEFKMVCRLHSRYYKHPIHYPCPCNKHTVQRYINDLSSIFKNGY